MASSRLLGPPPSFRYLNDDVAVGRRETSTLVQRAAVKDGIVEETPVGRQLKRDAVSRRTGDGRGVDRLLCCRGNCRAPPTTAPVSDRVRRRSCRRRRGERRAQPPPRPPAASPHRLPTSASSCQWRPGSRRACVVVRACVPARRTKRSFGRHRTHRSRSSGCSPAGWRLAGCRSPIYTGGSERPSRWPEEELRAVQVGQ